MRRLIVGSLLVVVLGLAVVPSAAADSMDRELLLAQALADLPPEWEIDRDKHVVWLDCNSPPQRWREWCESEALAWVSYDPTAKMYLNWRAIGEVGWWLYDSIVHEATHIAHYSTCDRDQRTIGLNQALLEHLALIYASHLGRSESEDACLYYNTRSRVRPEVLSWEDAEALEATLPWNNRPVGTYAHTEFVEYVAETVAAWYLWPRWLRYSDPAAYLAIEAHGLVEAE